MTQRPTRLLAIDPSPEGFGFAIFELPFQLVEAGLARIRGEKTSGAIRYFERLLSRFRPDALVIEDISAPGALRRPRIRDLLRRLRTAAADRGLPVYLIARTAVLARFAPTGEKVTKHRIAEILATYFPSLRDRLPPPRRIWQSEDERLAIFDALALAVTYAA